MKNRFKPMLFSAEMVKAILDGSKTQTRRTQGILINDEPENWTQNPDFAEDGMFIFINSNNTEGYFPKPRFDKGDIIWVRETFTEWPKEQFQYYAETALSDELGKWKPSIHMPKKACRLFLKVKNVRIERLQDITESDCIAEGASDRLKESDLIRLRDLSWIIPRPFSDYEFGFLALWCRINGCESWILNPWVWVIEFERIEKPLDFLV